jgi:hypothetical protein
MQCPWARLRVDSPPSVEVYADNPATPYDGRFHLPLHVSILKVRVSTDEHQIRPGQLEEFEELALDEVVGLGADRAGARQS